MVSELKNVPLLYSFSTRNWTLKRNVCVSFNKTTIQNIDHTTWYRPDLNMGFMTSAIIFFPNFPPLFGQQSIPYISQFSHIIQKLPNREGQGVLQDMWNQPTESFQTAAHAASQGEVTHSEESALYHPPHTWQLATVSVIDRGKGNGTPSTDWQFSPLAPGCGIVGSYTCDLPDNRVKAFQFCHFLPL